MKTIKNLEAYGEREVAVKPVEGGGYAILFRSKGALAATVTDVNLIALDDVAQDWIENGRVPFDASVHPGSEWTES